MIIKVIVIGVSIVGGILIVSYIVRSLYGGGPEMTRIVSPPTTLKTKIDKWWETPAFKSGLGNDYMKKRSVQGSGPTVDETGMVHYNDNIDESLLSLSDVDSERITFSDKSSVDPVTYEGNVAYSLFQYPDSNKYEVITSRDFYDMVDYPLIKDESYASPESFAFSEMELPPKVQVSINSSQNIDPAMTDGVVYYPATDDINNQNLLSMMKGVLEDREKDTSSVFLENNVLDSADFFIR